MNMEEPEALLGQREEDVVLGGEVAVKGCRAVLDALGDFSDRYVLIALTNEEVARRVQNGTAHGLPVTIVALSNPHLILAK